MSTQVEDRSAATPHVVRLKRWLQSLPVLSSFIGHGGPYNQWGRVVMNRETLKLIEGCNPGRLKVLEISGSFWKDRCKFKEYTSAYYPDYKVCESTYGDEKFDLVVAEQVFEHLPWPYRAGRHIYEMLNPGGLFLITTPFLIKVHEEPFDCSRWTPTGMRYFLAECGFPLEKVEAFAWGNRGCVKASLARWKIYQPWRHSLVNDPRFPVSVWALARKS
jgi:SAM-dependent methyltransferase